jgi:O-acetyl-ADP-ribose deacetylase (regulator of RNase III)
MNIEYRNGDLLKQDDIQIIAHQVNCQGVMGSGIAKQIKEQFPEAYNDYVAYCIGEEELIETESVDLLGDYCFTNIKGKYICNLFGQNNFGYNGNKFTNYTALISSLHNCIKYFDDNCYFYNNEQVKIGIPYKIGCDRGGGDWNIVELLLKDMCEIFPDNYTLVICKL